MNLLKKIKNHPKNKVALIDEQLQEITYYRLIQDAMFMKKFIKKNSVIFLIGSNTVEWITFYISALDKGAILFLIDSEIEFIYLKKLIKIYKPSFIFKPKDKKNFHFDEVSSFKNYHLLKNKSVNIINNDNLRLLISTSGTTGNPKFVKLSELNLDDNIEKIVEYLKIKKEHKLITTLPPHYSYGLSLINSHLYQGSSIILSNLSLINRGFWNLLKLSKASTFGAVPYHLEIMDKIKIKNLNFCNIKYSTPAGGSIEVNLLKKSLKFLSKRKIKLISMYGQTEASPRMSYLQPRFNLKKLEVLANQFQRKI